MQHEKSDYVIALVNFLSKNSLGDGNFGAGFVPNRYEEDDVRHNFDNPQEKCLSAALEYIAKGSFPAVTAKRHAEIMSSFQYPLMRDGRLLDIPLLVADGTWQKKKWRKKNNDGKYVEA